ERSLSGRRLAMAAFFLLAVTASGVAEVTGLFWVSPQAVTRVVVSLGLVVAAATVWFRGRSQLGLTAASALVVVATGWLAGLGQYWLALAVAAAMVVFLVSLGTLRKQEK
ncbi:MAG: hypothetical protein M3072_16425, partial [Candidatus Dormibacteraeota bacterium]|nr:hypothetical protein [Candidatus Dormibacteraeota bacterium]